MENIQTENTENTLSEKKRFQWISGSTLKLIAVISMLIDHIGVVFFSDMEVNAYFLSYPVNLYWIMRYIGRLAFPIYGFLLVEGFVHTRNRFAYGRRLLIFALLSEAPFDFAFSGSVSLYSQNVFFTLFLGYCGLCIIESDKLPVWKRGFLLFLLFFVAKFSYVDYGALGFGFVLILYLCRKRFALGAVIGSCILASDLCAYLAFIPIAFYNGKRGFIKGRFMQYAFYAVYPLHLLALFFIQKAMRG